MSTKNRLLLAGYLFLLCFLYVRNHINVQAQGVLPTVFVVCKTQVPNCNFVGDTALQQAIDAARSGDVIEVRAGTYNTSVSLSPKSLFIQGAGKQDTIINGSVTVNALKTSFIQIENLTIQNSQDSGIVLNGSPTFSLVSVNLLNHAQNGLEVGGDGTTVVKASRIQGNQIGLKISATGTMSIINSVIAKNASHGILRDSESIYLFQTTHSVFYKNGGDGIRMENVQLDIETTTIQNNIFTQNADFGVYTPTDPNDLFYGYNIFFQNTLGCANNLSVCNTEGTLLDTDPMLTDPDGNDFHPQASSPMINGGLGDDPDSSPADIGIYGGLFACDYDGTPEYCQTGGATATPLPSQNPVVNATFTPTPTPEAAARGQISGDANGDNIVTVADFEVWRSEFRNPGLGTQADFNGDGKVSAQDFEIWRSSFIR